jgi:hypothetical protein
LGTVKKCQQSLDDLLAGRIQNRRATSLQNAFGPQIVGAIASHPRHLLEKVPNIPKLYRPNLTGFIWAVFPVHPDRQVFIVFRNYRSLHTVLEPSNSIKEACRNAWKCENDSEVLVQDFNLSITRKDLKFLQHGNWLNDEVMNFYFSLIVERSRNSSRLPKVCYCL